MSNDSFMKYNHDNVKVYTIRSTVINRSLDFCELKNAKIVLTQFRETFVPRKFPTIRY